MENAGSLEGEIDYRVVRFEPGSPEEVAAREPFKTPKEVKELFINWLCIHPKHREPATITAFAEKYKISRRTCHKWKDSPEVDEEVRRRRARDLMDKDPMVLDALVKSAMILGKEGAADRKLYFEIRGYDTKTLNIKSEVVHKIRLDSMTDEQLALVAASENLSPEEVKEAAAELGVSEEKAREFLVGRMAKKLKALLEPPRSKQEVEDAEFEDITDSTDDIGSVDDTDSVEYTDDTDYIDYP